MSRPSRAVLVAGGTHPGGVAGLAADLETLRALGAAARLVVTVVTAQPPRGAARIGATPPALLRAQLDAARAHGPLAAVKIGLVATPAGARALAAWLRERRVRRVVFDPVLVSSGGARLASPAVARLLFPAAGLITPNIPEAEALSGLRIRTRAEVERAARRLRALGARAVLVKGGHLAAAPGWDYFFDGRTSLWLGGRHLAGLRPRGTGCRLASAIAVHWGAGCELPEAIRRARRFVRALLAKRRA